MTAVDTAGRKKLLRQEALRFRKQQDVPADSADRAALRFFESVPPPAWSSAAHSIGGVAQGGTLGGYWPKEHEFDIRPVLFGALSRGLTCALPVPEDELENGVPVLKFARWDRETTLVKGRWSVFHPPVDGAVLIRPDVLIVPLLIVDGRGYRLGYGGGYYDATIARLRAGGNVLAVGICHDFQIVLSDLPVEAHDERLDMVVTPDRVLDFRSRQ